MTKADALIELREKVVVGDCDYDSAWRYFVSRDMSGAQWATRFREAFCGSLDAAKALHEAVLPGWPWYLELTPTDKTLAWIDERHGLRRPGHVAVHLKPARAWLLAILDALIKQEKSTDDQS